MISPRSAKTLALLSNPRTRAFLAALSSGRRSVAELEAAGIRYGAVSKALASLTAAGLVTVPDCASLGDRLEGARISVAERLAEISAEVAP